MLTTYIQNAMAKAHYELMENGRYFGSVAGCDGVWAQGKTLEACRAELQSTLEDWLLLGLQLRSQAPRAGRSESEPSRSQARQPLARACLSQ